LISLHSAFQLPVFSLASGFHFPIAWLAIGAAPVPNTKTPKLAAIASGILRLSELLT
jgi:hypothetical protein